MTETLARPIAPAADFRTLGVSDAVCAVLDEQGITRPFPVQSAAIPEAIRGGDVLAKSPTGSGWSRTASIASIRPSLHRNSS